MSNDTTTEPDLRCYVCGGAIENFLVLISMKRDTDRVFLVHDGECADDVRDDGAVVVPVQRMQPSVV